MAWVSTSCWLSLSDLQIQNGSADESADSNESADSFADSTDSVDSVYSPADSADSPADWLTDSQIH